MNTLDVVDGKFELPKKHALSKEKRKLTIKTAYSSELQILNKDDWQVTVQIWFRRKGFDKPYIPEGFVDIDWERYVLKVKQ